MSGSTGATRAPVLAGRYELVRHIARGGMGDVHEATDRQLDRQVAVKQFRGTSPEDRPRFEAEILLLAQLNHPGLVQVYDAGEHDGESFVVLELVDGPPLREVLQRRGSIPAEELATLGAALADALAYVHANGVVHRDVTPANVLCGPDGRPRLADFGIARLLDRARITATSDAIGTAAYMAPEQLEGREVTTAADVYALGLVLLEALTGRRAFEGTGTEAAMARLARDPDVRTGVPSAWGDLLAAMTARDPAARPDAASTRDRLAALAAPRPERVAPDAAAALGAVPATGGDAPATTDADAETAAILAAAAAPPGLAPEVDPHAETAAIPVAEGTSVMPAALLPHGTEPASQRRPPVSPSASGAARPRRVVWGLVAGLAAVLVIALAAQSGGGIDVPTTTVPAAQTTVPTTAAPTTTAAPEPAAPVDAGDGDDEPEGKGRGSGKGKKDDD